jgi:hypothetical protein
LAALWPAPLAYAPVPAEPLRPRGEPFYGALIGDVQLFGVTPDLTGQGLDTIFTPGAEGELEAALGARAVPAPIPDDAPVTTASPLSGICSLPVDLLAGPVRRWRRGPAPRRNSYTGGRGGRANRCMLAACDGKEYAGGLRKKHPDWWGGCLTSSSGPCCATPTRPRPPSGSRRTSPARSRSPRGTGGSVCRERSAWAGTITPSSACRAWSPGRPTTTRFCSTGPWSGPSPARPFPEPHSHPGGRGTRQAGLRLVPHLRPPRTAPHPGPRGRRARPRG